MLPWYHLTWQIYLPTHYADNARLGGGFHRKARKVGTVFPAYPLYSLRAGSLLRRIKRGLGRRLIVCIIPPFSPGCKPGLDKPSPLPLYYKKIK